MTAEAEANKEQDKARRELVDLKNQVDHVVHQTDKQLEEHKDKLGEEDAQAIRDAKDELEKVAQGDDKAAIEKALENFQQKAMKLGLAKDVDDVLNNRVAERQQEIGPCFWWVVVLRSLGAVALALILAWAISLFIIFFAPDPPE